MKIAFIGVGQIGGSLLLRAREVFPSAELRACDRPEALAAIEHAGVADVVTADMARIVVDADIVVLAAPIDACIAMLPSVLAQSSGLVMDVCSVKKAIHAVAHGNQRFVGGHPMFGTEGQGFEAASAQAVVDAPFILTTDSANEFVDRAEVFVRALGAEPIRRTPEEHDAALARVSHLPQVVASALALAVGDDPRVVALGGPALRDMSRLAASPSDLWAPLLKHNAPYVRDAIDALIKQLGAVRDSLEDASPSLVRARVTKRKWPLVRAGRLADRVGESPTGAMLTEILRREALGEKIAPLHVGEPRLAFSAQMRALVGEATTSAPIAYTQTAGMLALRERVAHGRSVDEVIITSGAKQALHLALASLLAPGDEVLVPEPSWVSFAELVRLAGGKPIAVETTADAQLDPAAFAAAITPRTRALILNTPNNPTGAVYSQATLDAVLSVCAQHDLWLLSDELYRSFVFDGVHVSPIARYSLAKERGVLFDGIAKSHGMTGLRIGWAVGPRALLSRMVRLASHETSCASSVSQHIACAILDRYPQGDPALLAAAAARRDQLLATGRAMGPMQGAFYAWLKVDGSSRVAARELLARGVATMPGVVFGREGYLRLSYAVDEDVLTRALAVI